MTIKAIVCDIDGTLLTSNKIISKRTKEILIKAQEQGITLILASGRPTSGMFNLAKELNMDQLGGHLVSYNGGAVTNCATNELVFNQAMSVETGKKILDHLKNYDVIPMINKKDYMYVNNVYNGILDLEEGRTNIIEYESRGGNFKLCEIDDLTEFLDFSLNKILVAAHPEYLSQVYKELYHPFEKNVTAAFSAPFYFEFTDKGIDKAKALDTVFPSKNIAAEEMISFGDGQNDQTIIEYTGIGIAMGNAVADIKEVADDLTLSNDEDGIAVALEKYLKNQL